MAAVRSAPPAGLADSSCLKPAMRARIAAISFSRSSNAVRSSAVWRKSSTKLVLACSRSTRSAAFSASRRACACCAAAVFFSCCSSQVRSSSTVLLRPTISSRARSSAVCCVSRTFCRSTIWRRLASSARQGSCAACGFTSARIFGAGSISGQVRKASAALSTCRTSAASSGGPPSASSAKGEL